MGSSGKTGFTLVETAIVLVVIGLIIGGVLVGRDLIEAARVRATVQQIEALNTAQTAFLLKYNCIAGDCPNGINLGFTAAIITISDASPQPPAPGFFDHFNPISSALAFSLVEYDLYVCVGPPWPCDEFGTFSIPIGDGNYQLSVVEGLTAIRMLEQAKMINNVDKTHGVMRPKLSAKSPVSGRPLSIFPMYVSPRAGSVATVPGNYNMITATAIAGNAAAAALTPAMAFAIDSKVDDGLPLSGKALAAGNPMFPADTSAGFLYSIGDEDTYVCTMNSDGQLIYNVIGDPDADVTVVPCAMEIKSSI